MFWQVELKILPLILSNILYNKICFSSSSPDPAGLDMPLASLRHGVQTEPLNASGVIICRYPVWPPPGVWKRSVWDDSLFNSLIYTVYIIAESERSECLMNIPNRPCVWNKLDKYSYQIAYGCFCIHSVDYPVLYLSCLLAYASPWNSKNYFYLCIVILFFSSDVLHQANCISKRRQCCGGIDFGCFDRMMALVRFDDEVDDLNIFLTGKVRVALHCLRAPMSEARLRH